VEASKGGGLQRSAWILRARVVETCLEFVLAQLTAKRFIIRQEFKDVCSHGGSQQEKVEHEIQNWDK
jgi:hypothetical protein